MFDKNINGSEFIMERTVEKSYDCPEIKYSLFRNIVFDEEWGNRESYTIVCECEGDACILTDVTSLSERAEQIFKMFVENKVTPIGANDVIEEMI